eukprot:Skav218180  [mRNA]  locus=scaffold5213:199462:200015:+ [translate_table: standard]
MVRRQTTVSARPREDRAICPAQKNTAIADIAHAEMVIASGGAWCLDNNKSACGATGLIGIQELLVQAQCQSCDCCIIRWHPTLCQLF